MSTFSSGDGREKVLLLIVRVIPKARVAVPAARDRDVRPGLAGRAPQLALVCVGDAVAAADEGAKARAGEVLEAAGALSRED